MAELLLRALAARGVPAMIANGRLSDRSFRRYRLVRGAMRRVLADVTVFAMQSDEDARRVIALGAAPERVVVTGNSSTSRCPIPAGAADLWHRLLGLGARAAGVDRRQHAPRRGGGGAGGARGRPVRRGPTWRWCSRRAIPERVGEVMQLVAARGFTAVRRSELPGARAGSGDARHRARHGRRAGPALLDRRRRVRGRQPVAVRWPQHARARRCAASRCCSGPTPTNFREAAALLLGQPAGGRRARRRRARAPSCSRLLADPTCARRRGTAAREAVALTHGAVAARRSSSSRAICTRRRRRERARRGCVRRLGARLQPPAPTACWPRWPAAIADCSAAREWLYARGVLRVARARLPRGLDRQPHRRRHRQDAGGRAGGADARRRSATGPAVVSRGYGRRGGGVQVVADAASIRLDAEEAGDEPFLLARRLPGRAGRRGRQPLRGGASGARAVRRDARSSSTTASSTARCARISRS